MALESMTANFHKKCFLIKYLDVICLVLGIENGEYLKWDKRMEQVLLFKRESSKTILNNNRFTKSRDKK